MEALRTAMREKTPAKRRFSRGQVNILLALAVANLAIYGAASAIVVQLMRLPALITVEPARESGLELRTAHGRAQAWAQRWQKDAQLVAVVTRWQAAGSDRLTPYRPSWSFSFYSPAAGQVQTLTVDQAGLQPVRQVSVSTPPVPVEADWSLDSGDLLQTFMAYGGDAFIRQHPRATVHFRLSGQRTGRPIWYLTAIDPEARQSFVVGVDALSRQVVQAS